MHYEEETLIRSPFLMSFDEEEEKDISEGGPLPDDVIDELDDDGLSDDGPSWEDEDSLDDDEEEVEEEF